MPMLWQMSSAESYHHIFDRYQTHRANSLGRFLGVQFEGLTLTGRTTRNSRRPSNGSSWSAASTRPWLFRRTTSPRYENLCYIGTILQGHGLNTTVRALPLSFPRWRTHPWEPCRRRRLPFTTFRVRYCTRPFFAASLESPKILSHTIHLRVFHVIDRGLLRLAPHLLRHREPHPGLLLGDAVGLFRNLRRPAGLARPGRPLGSHRVRGFVRGGTW
jgi:hypothetical protein